MENPSQRPGGIGTFLKGFMSSAGSGALMSGIFYTLAIGLYKFGVADLLHLAAKEVIAGQLLGWGAAFGSVMTGALVMIAAVAVFGGVMAVMREKSEAKQATVEARSGVRVRSHEGHEHVMVPMVAAGVMADRDEAPRTSWVSRTGGDAGHRDRIQEILNRGDMSDKSRASALLAEREASANQQTQI